MRTIRVENPGPHYRLLLAEGVKPVPAPGEVLIKVAAAGLNRADHRAGAGQCIRRRPARRRRSAWKCRARSAEFGRGVQGLEQGQPVCALLAGGGYAEYALAPAECVLPVPTGVDLVQAAACPKCT